MKSLTWNVTLASLTVTIRTYATEGVFPKWSLWTFLLLLLHSLLPSVERSEDNLWWFVLSFHHVDSGDQTLAMRIVGKDIQCTELAHGGSAAASLTYLSTGQ